MITCRYLVKGKAEDRCELAKLIAGVPCMVTETACEVCVKEPQPKSINRVTVSYALRALWESDLKQYRIISERYKDYLSKNASPWPEREETLTPTGPGYELHMLLDSLGFEPDGSCNCIKLANQMNEKGPDWCEENVNCLAEKIQEEANKRGFTGILAKLGAKPAIYLAIKRARDKERQLHKQLQNRKKTQDSSRKNK